MPITIMTRDARTTSERARADGDDSGCPPTSSRPPPAGSSSGGLCRGPVRVPVYGEAMGLLTERDGVEWLNFAGFARYLEQPYARDDARSAWYFGDGAREQRERLQFLSAPDFELQDLEAGRTASQTRGGRRRCARSGPRGEGAASTCRSGKPCARN